MFSPTKIFKFNGKLVQKSFENYTFSSPWRGHLDNFVMLCKFEIIIIVRFYRNLLSSQFMNPIIKQLSTDIAQRRVPYFW